MKILGAAFVLFLAFCGIADAQTALVVSSCGTLPAGIVYALGQQKIITQDTTGKTCTNSTTISSVTANQGNTGTNAQAWWVQIGDTANGPVAVKPASTAPAATDPALVVTISPNTGAIVINGNVSNANSGVATSSSNVPSISYNYGFNGVSWDQLQVDASKFLKVNVQTSALPSGASTSANQTNGNQKSQIVDGSGNVVGSSSNNLNVNENQIGGTSYALGQAAPANSAPVVEPDASSQLTGSCSSACLNTALFSVDTTGYRSISLQVTSPGSAAITYQGSNDSGPCSSATNWSGLLGYNPIGGGSIGSSSTAIAVIFPKLFRCFRAEITAYTSGTVTIEGYLLTAPVPPFGTQVVSVNGTASVSQSASATGGYTYAHIVAGAATTVIKASAGTLHSITFGGAATSLNTTTIYDNASGAGTVIGVPSVTALVAPTTLIYDIAFTNGLTIITATANGADMTVAFK
jgi:hypothetical protein